MSEKYLTVTQVNSYIKNLMASDFILKNVWVMGEVSNCKLHSSGHVYFTLKDNGASISCVQFKGYRNPQDKTLGDGMKIIANGSVSVYEKTGQYQLYIREYQESGVGQLYQEFEFLKKELQEKGWFLEENKKPLPFYPKKVGIVTSATGAAIQDILNISNRRNPYIQLVLYPSLVQGEEAKYSIAKAIGYLDKIEDIEVIIIGRGGGSIEDLWPFNEKIVAEAIYMATTPIISAVGHETDFTISDFVSDLRAPTPSAAAELAIPSIEEMLSLLESLKSKLDSRQSNKLEYYKRIIELYSAKFERYHPKNSINQTYLYLNDLQDIMEKTISDKIKALKNKIILLEEKLKRVSPMHKLKDGYAYISDENDKQIKSISSLENHKTINVLFYDGQAKVKVTQIIEGSKYNG